MSWLGKLFGTEKAVEEGAKTIRESVDWIGRGIDAAIHTDEEKAAEFKELTQMRMGMVRDLQDQFAPRSVTRRILAVIVFSNFFLHLNLAVIFWYLGLSTDFVLNVIEQEADLVLLVAFFYFGYYGIKQAIKQAKG
jgi:hypothetical protein